eukprot:11216166-Heterocapsa_arctica.AAC.1
MTSRTLGSPSSVTLTGLCVAIDAFRSTSIFLAASLNPGPRMKKSRMRCSPPSGIHVSTWSSPT